MGDIMCNEGSGSAPIWIIRDYSNGRDARFDKSYSGEMGALCHVAADDNSGGSVFPRKLSRSLF